MEMERIALLNASLYIPLSMMALAAVLALGTRDFGIVVTTAAAYYPVWAVVNLTFQAPLTAWANEEARVTLFGWRVIEA